MLKNVHFLPKVYSFVFVLRRITSISLILLFLIGTAGVPLKAHFCGDHLAAVTIAKDNVDEDGCCGEDNDCCSDQALNFNVDKDFLSQGKEVRTLASTILFQKNMVAFVPPMLSLLSREVIAFEDPPDEHLPSRQIRYACFLI